MFYINAGHQSQEGFQVLNKLPSALETDKSILDGCSANHKICAVMHKKVKHFPDERS